MPEYINRILKKPKQSFFLFGPRGTGKTTWVSREFPTAYRINLLDEALYQTYLADISQFSGEIRILENESWVFIDEIQRIPNLLNEVHRFIEEKQLKFILTGSSARKVRQAGVNLLAGRAWYKQMFPFLPEELGESFELDSILQFGSIPLILNSPDKKESLKAYVQLYLKEEIKAEALVRNLPGFVRFLPVAGLFHGQVVNISGIARDAGVSRTTIQGYLEILEDTLMAFRLRAFESHVRVREKKHPKLYWGDPGIVRAVNNRFGELYPGEKGVLFEGLIAMMLRSYQSYKELFDDFYYWAPAGAVKTEVDFVLKRRRELIAIEAKVSGRIHNEHLKGLKAIGDVPGLTRKILVYPGNRKILTEDKIEILPFNDFSRMLASGRL
ncbi:MAG: ATP-binding protein [Spirochaetota bacterium]